MLRKLSINDEVYDLVLGRVIVSCVSNSYIECNFGTAAIKYTFDGVDKTTGGIRRLYIGKLDINIKEIMNKDQIVEAIKSMISLTNFESVDYSYNYDVLLKTWDADCADEGDLDDDDWEELYAMNDHDDEVNRYICLLPGLEKDSAEKIVKFLINNRIKPKDALQATREILMKGLQNG